MFNYCGSNAQRSVAFRTIIPSPVPHDISQEVLDIEAWRQTNSSTECNMLATSA